VPDFLTRFSYPLTYLLLACLCVTRLAASPTPSELSLPSRVILELTVPVERMVTLPVTFVRRVWNGYVSLVGVKEKNQELRSRIVELEEENLQYREEIVASERFRRLRHLREQNDMPLVPATVIAQDLSPWFRSVIINRGTSAGIATGINAARVLLLVDPQSRVDVYVQRTRARGTVHGTAGEVCAFEYVVRDEDLEVGDLLLTSGLDTVFPKGLPVGRVTALERKPYGLFLEAEIEPAVDLNRLEEVFVSVDRREIPPPEAFETDEGVLFSDRSSP
jgi:rod shape-determining protein MreC